MVLLLKIYRLFLGFVLSFVPMPMEAGAWQRSKGEGFVSISNEYSHWEPDIFGDGGGSNRYASLYGEYGFRDKLIIGFDAGSEWDGQYRGFIFAQTPIRQRERGLQISYAFGAGVIAEAYASLQKISLGYGLEHGWVTADAQLFNRFGYDETGQPELRYDWKIDVTWGLNFNTGPTRGHKAILQLQTGQDHQEDMLVKLAPSYVVPLLNDALFLEVGAVIGLTGAKAKGGKMGVWYQF